MLNHMRHLLFKSLMLIALLFATAFHMNAQSTTVALVVTTIDGEEQTHFLSDASRLYFENGETLVINDGADATISYELAKIRKIVCSEVTGTQESSLTQIQLLPNPSRDRFIIQNLSDNSIARVYSIDGRLVKTFQASEGLSVDITDLTSGMYLLNINGQTLKLMKL